MAEKAKKDGAARRSAAAAPAANPTAPIVNASNETVGEASLAPAVFGVAVNEHLLYEVVKQERAGLRRGTHMTKNRALVSGSGRKPWRQKGTGRARVGETRNPLWRHGGTVFGPQPRDYSYDVPRKVRAAALRSAISLRVSEGAFKVVDGLTAETPKTKTLRALLDRLGAKGKALLIESRPAPALVLSSRNLAGVRVVDPLRLTVYDVLDCRTLLVTREAVGKLEERLTP
jgi:large subunit ribosomal protein L4